ncbi:ABC transporter permease subunit [Rhodospirillaceae bacterium SYSU D60014]|uniref:ABC transporter permease n=1 Tax=Virgifigura deserti TaxID=2268457 RepID=UPI000E6624BE
MSATAGIAGAQPARLQPWPVLWAVLLGATFLLFFSEGLHDALEGLAPWAFEYPRAWVIPLRDWVSGFMQWLINDFDLGLFTFKEFTRSISWLLTWPFAFANSLLAEGFIHGRGDKAVLLWPRLSWLAVIAIAVLMGFYAQGWRLALLVGACFAYLAVFGQWTSAMVTLSSIAIAVPFGVVGGLLLGIAGFRSARVERAMAPVLDLMQTVPIFAYLIPALYLFGFGPVASMIATIIYATPPMVRMTILALRQVPDEIVDFGRMAGCSRRQLLWKVRIPAARQSLMVGVNQVIMLSLNMVIIASMIGAGGLGYDVLTALRRLDIGAGLEAGIGIVVLAIALDRLSQAFAARPPEQQREDSAGLLRRHPYLAAGLAAAAVTWIGGLVLPALGSYPESLTLTTAPFWDGLVSWININFFDALEAIKTFLLLNLMIPVKRFLLTLPWPLVVGLVALAGYQLGGLRLAALTAALVLFLAVTRQWENAMETVYLCGVSALIASLIGWPIGIWAARKARVNAVVQPVIDTLQTLPAFVYLIPAVMLFRVGDFTAMIAVVAYAVVPAIRYTILGIQRVPPTLIEAATAQGCTRRQILWRVQLPLALPEILLGVNQTIMMALSMLVITALVGTRDLGQEVYIALTKADTGRGIVAGLCVAFIAITADRLIGAWSGRLKTRLGLA